MMSMFAQNIYRLKRVYHLVKTGLLRGVPAQFRYNFPQKKLIICVITGTDGKTTSSTLLYHILNTSGKKTALISTVGAFFGHETQDTGFHVTSPQPDDMYRFMREAIREHCTHLVLEATSHGAYQYRTWGIHANVAGLTNISHEHLDYHGTYEEYVRAKLLILKAARVSIINADDQSYKVIKKLEPQRSFQTYSAEDELPPVVRAACNKRFAEPYNRMNARLVYAMARKLGVSDAEYAAAIATFPGVTGRMEHIVETPFRVIVDFAHTPKAVAAALDAGKKLVKSGGKLIAVYGSAGLRDRSKRPLMGQAGVERADTVVLTAEDPRTEDVWSIIRQMKEQLTSGHERIVSIPDRKEAITFALTQLAKKGDCVMILGKGHERSMCYGTTETPWSDQDAVRQVLESTNVHTSHAGK